MCDEEYQQRQLAYLDRIYQRLGRPPIDETYTISTTQPLVIDYKERRFLLIWSATSLLLTIEDIGYVTVPANTWTGIDYQQGQRLVPANISAGTNVTVFVRATDYGLPTDFPQGQLPGAYSVPVVIASDQTVPISGKTLEIVGTAGAQNADLIPATDVSNYRQFSIQILGAWVGTISFQGSNDGINFFSIMLSSFIPSTLANQISTTVNGQFIGPLGFRYLRVRMTGYTSGTATSVAELFSTDTAPIDQYVQAIQQGPWSISPAVSGGTSDFHLVSAASNNATVVKASGGQVYGWTISNTNAAYRYVKLYNKSTAPAPASDTPFRTIGVPPNSSVNFSTVCGLAMGTGIGVAAVTGIADNDNTSVGASDLVIDLDWK